MALKGHTSLHSPKTDAAIPTGERSPETQMRGGTGGKAQIFMFDLYIAFFLRAADEGDFILDGRHLLSGQFRNDGGHLLLSPENRDWEAPRGRSPPQWHNPHTRDKPQPPH